MISGCSLAKKFESNESNIPHLDFYVKEEDWSSWGRGGSSRSYVVEVKEGEGFGLGDGYLNSKAFTLLKINEDGSALIRFDSGLIVLGEDIDKDSEQNPIMIGYEEKCFTTRTFDGGRNFCIRVAGNLKDDAIYMGN